MQADIFFFVTTIAVVLVALVFTVTLIYLIRVLRSAEGIMNEIKAETVLFREDIQDLRGGIKTGIKKGVARASSFMEFFGGWFSSIGKRHKKAKKRK